MKLTGIRIPVWVHRRALKVLTQMQQQRVSPKRLQRNGYLSLSVNPRWRMLSKDNGQSWEVMSHETYNARITR